MKIYLNIYLQIKSSLERSEDSQGLLLVKKCIYEIRVFFIIFESYHCYLSLVSSHKGLMAGVFTNM